MAGIDKTTLIKMIFNDRELCHEFFTRLWIYVSRTMNRKQLFMDIISKFTKVTSGYKDTKEEELAERIQDFLKEEKYFIVVDNVGRTEDWDYLRTAFPNNQKGSRILVTTRILEVANHVDSKNAPHKFPISCSISNRTSNNFCLEIDLLVDCRRIYSFFFIPLEYGGRW
ncbi:PREDICTED: disease resistance protein RPP13-like [Ipomoea nil]|uniref:disease resistance protein RPP13-like n=1 Tax=Ipomoea nil TaxID=35883 RepID=UPI0009012AD5|nr:PREDICTED: disease resistance protein RPP13-like [Ipomoea nil]